MTPLDKNKLKDGAQVRAMDVVLSGDKKRIDTEYYAEGYAANYERYLLYDDPDPKYQIWERFEPGCFAGADMKDVIMQYDHEGKVMARTSNKTLIVDPDERGLFVAADLSKTEASRSLHEDIEAGMVTKMSWRFMPGDYHYDQDTQTIVHTHVKKIYDVSAVSIPANDTTSISARSLVDGEIAKAARSEAELNERRKKLKLKIQLGGIQNESKN